MQLKPSPLFFRICTLQPTTPLQQFGAIARTCTLAITATVEASLANWIFRQMYCVRSRMGLESQQTVYGGTAKDTCMHHHRTLSRVSASRTVNGQRCWVYQMQWHSPKVSERQPG